jgi:cytochrome b
MMMTAPQRTIRVWDIPTRVFHWCLPVALIALFVSADTYAMELHALVGEAVLALVLFRLVWGFVGSQTARFRDFVVGPRGIADYLAGRAPKSLGHNPVGALMVLALLGALLGLAVSGLFADDGIFYSGPLAGRIGNAQAVRIGELHAAGAYVLAALAGIHVLATLWHLLHRKRNLITPMLTGRTRTELDAPPPVFVGLPLACGVFTVAVGVVTLLLHGLTF